MAKRWYVVHVYSGFEKKIAQQLKELAAQKGLSDMLDQVLVPSEEVVEVRRGQKINSERKFFPGYVLVKMELTDQTWHLIKETPKVTGFLGTKTRPSPISEAEADRIMKQSAEGVERVRPAVLFEIGEQIRVAAGQALGYTQADIHFRGHAIECRVIAEDPETFIPAPGRVDVFHAPGGLGVRVDSALYAGYLVPPYYDSMVAKLIVHAPTRPEAIARMRRALDEFVIQGIKTSLPLHRRIMEAPEFVAGDYTIHWLERFVAGG